MILFKIIIAICLVAWSAVGVTLVVRFNELFGPHHDHQSETPGARSFGVAQIAAVWVGGVALGIYFICV
jgi:hypothetical protein